MEFIEIDVENYEEIEAVKEIEKEAFADGAIDEWVIKPIARYGKIMAVKEEKEIAGIVEMWKMWDENKVYIFSVAVRNKYRGMGYGSFLLEKTINYLKEQGIKEVMLTVSPENKKALNLYKKFEFKEEKLLKDEYGKNIDRLKLKKVLIKQ